MATKKSNFGNFKKKDIIKNISLKTGISFLYSAQIVDNVISILITNLKLNKKIKIKNFGIFDLLKKNQRIGRNPKNKNKYEISERIVITFKASDVLKKKINYGA
jgi:integration host factor subunit alpha